MDPILHISGLTKTYTSGGHSLTVLKDISVTVRNREFYISDEKRRKQYEAEEATLLSLLASAFEAAARAGRISSVAAIPPQDVEERVKAGLNRSILLQKDTSNAKTLLAATFDVHKMLLEEYTVVASEAGPSHRGAYHWQPNPACRIRLMPRAIPN